MQKDGEKHGASTHIAHHARRIFGAIEAEQHEVAAPGATPINAVADDGLAGRELTSGADDVGPALQSGDGLVELVVAKDAAERQATASTSNSARRPLRRVVDGAPQRGAANIVVRRQLAHIALERRERQAKREIF